MTRDPHLFVILGATGDLTTRKLLPALYSLMGSGGCHVLGAAVRDLDDDGYRRLVVDALVADGVPRADAEAWARRFVFYQQVGRDADHGALAARVEVLDSDHDLGGNRVLYLALPPNAFATSIEGLGRSGLAESEGWTRLVIEKPFGTDATSAADLNEITHRWFSEQQTYRIDHYLGKETVQNLLVFRFTNPLFEASWNRDRVERVEITVAETVDVTGRGGYYEQSGVVRDMVQSHLTQLLTLVAMESPSTFRADAVRDEKVKVLRSIRAVPPDDVVLGQYTSGVVDGSEVPAYRDTEGVASDSSVPTHAAVRIWIDNWRWQGVPFLLRTGKAMARRVTEVAVVFRRPPICLFHSIVDDCIATDDVLRLILQPEEGFSLEIDVKEPGDSTRLRTIPLRFAYGETFGEIPDAYETLLADVIEGDQTLFVRADEVEEAWRLFTPVVGYDLPIHPYPAGTWGPSDTRRILPDGVKRWSTPD